MIFEPRAADLHPVDVENALLRAAVGDYADEAAVLLRINLGHWLLQLQSAGLISFVPDGEGHGRGSTGPELYAALCSGSPSISATSPAASAVRAFRRR